MHSNQESTSGKQRSSNGIEIQVRSNPTFERQNSHTKGSSKSQSASSTNKSSESCYITGGPTLRKTLQRVEIQITPMTLQEKSQAIMIIECQNKEEAQITKRKLKKQIDKEEKLPHQWQNGKKLLVQLNLSEKTQHK